MRTTITLDNDVEILLREIRTEKQTSFKKSVNDLIRAGFNAVKKRTESQKKDVYRIKPISVGEVLDTSDCPTNILESLESVEEFGLK